MWYRRAAIYQIYPLSFQDSDGDGKGDLPGLIRRLDYLEWLGVDALWLCPVYRSPMDDFGYDISSYTEIDPTFGTLDDFDTLVEEAHRRQMRLILDFVPNHTSDLHPWFVQSRSSRDNERADWYFWADPAADGGPPTNWLSRFGGSAWEWEPKRGQYYYHAFLKSQPDLNCTTPRCAPHSRTRCASGCGVAWTASAWTQPRCWPTTSSSETTRRTRTPTRRPRRPSVRSESSRTRCRRRWTISPSSVGSPTSSPTACCSARWTPTARRSGSSTAPERPLVQLPLSYRLLEEPWNADRIAGAIRDYLGCIPPHGWPLWGIGGQDKERVASRVGPEQARVAAMLALTLCGTPLFFAGDEIGMHQVCRPDAEARDPFEHLVPGFHMNRDPQRTPMQWDSTAHAGFSVGAPWLEVADDYRRQNVELERADPRSLLQLYRRLLALRRQEAALTEGSLEALAARGNVLSYLRRRGDRLLHVALNLGKHTEHPELPAGAEVLLSTHVDRDGERVGSGFELRPDEGVLTSLF